MNSTYWMKQSRQENMIYLVVWGMLFAAPVLSMYVRTVSDTSVTFNWAEVLVVWRIFSVYLLLFLIHNFLLAPLLVHGHKRLAYFSFLTVLIGLFAIYQCNSRPEQHPVGEREQWHTSPPADEDGRGHQPPPHDMKMDRDRGMDSDMDMQMPPEPPRHEFRHGGDIPPIVGERDILATVMLILLFGANLGIKGYFRSRDDRRRLDELKKQNLEQQLEYLRYQINPHFFMNTLNNIHALVDIDPAKAQETILELSKMMRFVLYEGDKHGVPLTKETEFIRTYVKLMQLRYTDKVRITLDLPDEVPDRTIPPLILISFIENAFKHGVSYQRESFIEVTVVVTTDDKLQFVCRNSKAEVTQDKKTGGVGLTNVRKRLSLLYGHDYTLTISDTTDVYYVELVIPLTVNSNTQ